MTGPKRMAGRWAAMALLAQFGLWPSASAAEDYVTSSPGLLCETPEQIAETIGHMAENDKKALGRLEGCRLIENGSTVRIVSRDRFVAKVIVGTAPNPITGYMPIQSITNARGDPID